MVYCEGTHCKKRDTCTFHCDTEPDVVYEYIDFSVQGSGSAGVDSSGKAYCAVEYWCGDNGSYTRYKPSKTANITEYDYDTMWNLLKHFIETHYKDTDNIKTISDILFHMNHLEDQFAPSFAPKVKIEDIRKEFYENWNHYKYEDYNKCPCCNNKLHMTGQVSSVQMFNCTVCAKRFALDVDTGKLTFIK